MATKISERQRGDITVLEIVGDLDQLFEERMTKMTDDLIGRGRLRLALDVAEMSFVDSAGVGALVSLYKRVRGLGGDLKLSGLRGQPRELFKLLRLDRTLQVFEDLDAAVKALLERRT